MARSHLRCPEMTLAEALLRRLLWQGSSGPTKIVQRDMSCCKRPAFTMAAFAVPIFAHNRVLSSRDTLDTTSRRPR